MQPIPYISICQKTVSWLQEAPKRNPSRCGLGLHALTSFERSVISAWAGAETNMTGFIQLWRTMQPMLQIAKDVR